MSPVLKQLSARGKLTRVTLIFLDVIVITLSWFGAYFLRQNFLSHWWGYEINPMKNYFGFYPVILLMCISANFYFGMYRRKKDTTGFDDITATIQSSMLAMLTISTVSFFFKELDIARSVVLINWLLVLGGYGIVRLVVRSIESSWKKSGYLHVNCIIIGTGSTAIRALQKILDHPEIGYNVLGFVAENNDVTGEISGKPVLGSITSIEEIVDKFRVDEIVVAVPHYSQDFILKLISKLSGRDITFRVISNVFEVLSSKIKVDSLEEFPVFDIGTGNVSVFYVVFKRIFDFLASSILLVLTLPAWIVIAVAIKLDSPGPVFFVHERVGYKGRLFRMYKFRTMYSDVKPYEEAPRKQGDPRITRVGHFLRRTSLDELPQLLNVIKGDMSLVGPRPEMPFIVEKYNEWQKLRLNAVPGITGLWQILGRKDIPLHENLEYDFYYIKNRSLLFDLVILLKTIPAVLLKRGAY